MHWLDYIIDKIIIQHVHWLDYIIDKIIIQHVHWLDYIIDKIIIQHVHWLDYIIDKITHWDSYQLIHFAIKKQSSALEYSESSWALAGELDGKLSIAARSHIWLLV